MARLIALSPTVDLLPLKVGPFEIVELRPEAITSIAPFRGQERTVSRALEASLGARFPAAGRSTGKEGARIVWTGLGEAMVLGPRVEPEGAAITDQSDAWAVLRLTGAGAEDVLARLVPVDVRASVFKRGHAARTLLGHVPLSLVRTASTAFDLMVFRSMVRTAVHDLHEAMLRVTART